MNFLLFLLEFFLLAGAILALCGLVLQYRKKALFRYGRILILIASTLIFLGSIIGIYMYGGYERLLRFLFIIPIPCATTLIIISLKH